MGLQLRRPPAWRGADLAILIKLHKSYRKNNKLGVISSYGKSYKNAPTNTNLGQLKLPEMLHKSYGSFEGLFSSYGKVMKKLQQSYEQVMKVMNKL